jgi:uncharacterized protein DUF6438
MRLELVALVAFFASCRIEGTGTLPRGSERQVSSFPEEVHLGRRWPGSNDFLSLTLMRIGDARCGSGWPTWPVRGENTGTLGDGDFDEVAALIDGLGLQDLVGKLQEPRSFEGSITLKWRREGSEAFTTLECAELEAPLAMEAVALAVEAIGRRVLWRAVEPQRDATALPPGVPERYAFLYGLGTRDVSERELATALPYERIELERSGCFGSCPAFLLQLNRDGSATWEGRAYSAPGGRQVGTVGLAAFARMCWFVEKLNLESLAGDYNATWTDDSTTTVRLFKPDGKVVVFRDYGRRSPIEVFALADMIELVAHRNGWAQREELALIDAVVLEVDHELQIIVLDKGLKDGARVGYLLDVYLDSKYKGIVQVEEVQETTCLARILSEKNAIAVGDSATTSL